MITDTQVKPTSTQSNCLGVVLAGGLSSRMGQDKAQLLRQKQAMLDFSKQLLCDSGITDVVVSGNTHDIPDIVPQAGPVGGIYSVLSHYTQVNQPKALLILPVDLPLMTANALQKLRLAGELSQQATYFTDSQGNAHNIPLYLPNSALLALFLQKAFAAEHSMNATSHGKKHGPSIKALLREIPSQSLALTARFANSNILFNSNTPQDWQKAQQCFNQLSL